MNDIDDDWLTEKVTIEEEPDDNIENASKEQLESLLKSVDQKLIHLYTHRNTLENKHEKRSLQRLKKKIIDKLNKEDV